MYFIYKIYITKNFNRKYSHQLIELSVLNISSPKIKLVLFSVFLMRIIFNKIYGKSNRVLKYIFCRLL